MEVGYGEGSEEINREHTGSAPYLFKAGEGGRKLVKKGVKLKRDMMGDGWSGEKEKVGSKRKDRMSADFVCGDDLNKRAKGLGNPWKVQKLQSWCWRDRPNFVFVMESMIDSGRLEGIRNRCGFSEWMCVSSIGNSGGLELWWKEVNAHVISYSNHHIVVVVRNASNDPLYAVVGVYGWPERELKYRTFELMKSLKDDFNEILSEEEKYGGARRSERMIDLFREAMEVCALNDLGYKGNFFTWKKGNDPQSIVRERLDRFLGHRRRERSITSKPYKWLAKADCQEVVKAAWLGTSGMAVSARIAREIVAELDELHKFKESYWHGRARANELRDGDKNTSYFHHKAINRQCRNHIMHLKDENGIVRDDELEMKRIISRNSREWDLDMLNTHLTHDDASMVRSISLSKRFPEDVRFWWPTENGIYTTKSRYWLGRLGHVRGWELQFGDANAAIWKIVWGTKGPPTLCHFLCVLALVL
uniref:Uncharacterized protein n=1 Tax=Chenopodium quinoa TaxID=63459 RepID=A0A803KTN4_CHEQI